MRIGHERGLCDGLQPGHRRGDLVPRARLASGFEMSDGILEIGDAFGLQEVALVVEDLLGLLRQVARLPVDLPECVAER